MKSDEQLLEEADESMELMYERLGWKDRIGILFLFTIIIPIQELYWKLTDPILNRYDNYKKQKEGNNESTGTNRTG